MNFANMINQEWLTRTFIQCCEHSRSSRSGVQARGRGEDEGDQRGLRPLPQEVWAGL